MKYFRVSNQVICLILLLCSLSESSDEETSNGSSAGILSNETEHYDGVPRIDERAAHPSDLSRIAKSKPMGDTTPRSVIVAGQEAIEKQSATTTIGQRSNLLDRIYNGDYVWSLGFPKEDILFIGYGYALLSQLREKCPDVVSQSELDEISFFATTVFDVGSELDLSEILGREVTLIGAMAGLRAAASADVDRMRKASTCDGPEITRVGRNLVRMLAGRRPAYRGEAVRQSTFVSEKVVPIDSYHYYTTNGPSMAFGAAARVFQNDIRQVKEFGLTILECRYDQDPADQFYELQYYWGPSLASEVLYPIQIIWGNFIVASQERMDTAMGSGQRGRARAIHPFTTYGSPRRECPDNRDPDLRVEQIPAPKKMKWNPKPGTSKQVGNGVFEFPGEKPGDEGYLRLWELPLDAMSSFVYFTHGRPKLTGQRKENLDSIGTVPYEERIKGYHSFAAADTYYPTPTQMADFYISWYIPEYTGDKEKLRASIVAYESVAVTQEEIDEWKEADRVDYVRRYRSILVRDRIIRNLDDGSYEILNAREYDSRRNSQVLRSSTISGHLRNRHFQKEHPDKKFPYDLTGNMGKVRYNSTIRRNVIVGVMTENFLAEAERGHGQ